jgi:kinesin family protein 5
MIKIKGLTRIVARNLLNTGGENDLIRIFNDGLDHRLMRDTEVNEASSRSHLLFTILIKSWVTLDAVRYSKLTFVDLAGSERLAMINFEEFLYEEAIFINESLQCLGKVINLITRGFAIERVPYGFNLLTSLL